MKIARAQQNVGLKCFKIGMMELIFPSFLIVSHSFYLLLHRLSGLFRQQVIEYITKKRKYENETDSLGNEFSGNSDFIASRIFSTRKNWIQFDAAGNRVKRQIIMPVPKTMAKQQNFFSDNQSFSDMLCYHSVKIYPNPSKGVLKICIFGLKDS